MDSSTATITSRAVFAPLTLRVLTMTAHAAFTRRRFAAAERSHE
jgi:hypothetical protein